MAVFKITDIQLRNGAGSLLGLAPDVTVTCENDLDAIHEAVKAELEIEFDASFTYEEIAA